MDTLTQLGIPGLFIAAFLAATLLPLSSELVLSALLLSGLPPYTLVFTATLGNVLGSVCNYALGFGVGEPLAKKWLRLSSNDIRQAEKRFEKYGLASLLLSWVPIIGDPITFVAGIFRVRFSLFLLLITIAKLARYLILAQVILTI